ncbi:MAG: UDP-N-acetylmuramate dehydrogenase [Labilithrix sp.]|nr:UDP-N-acetylmuramate dehydrogenase [Labilithrix sp.]
MRVVDNAPLAPLTTLRLGGPARRLVTVERERDAIDAVRELDDRREALLVLGGGSNLVISDAGFDGTVVRMAARGRATSAARDGRVLVTAEAGEPWDDLVAALVEEGLAGVECLAGIPGLVGAVPMQNVGAYGQDVGETIVSVRAYDRARREIVELPREACAFAYRSNAFRGEDRHVIVAVTFALERSAESRPIRYAELARALGVVEGARAPLAAVRSTVIALRRRKGMVLDPADLDTASAGSFFTNPIVSASELESLRARARDEGPMPVFAEPDGRFKVSAGWLIERAGFTKGFAGEGGRVAVSGKHALALTNRGGATTHELVALARRIRDGVRERFGVTLENEPVLVGDRL